MKKILFFAIFILNFALCQNLERVYLEKGIEAVKDILEQNISSKNFWLDFLKDKETKYGFYDSVTNIAIVDKKAQKMSVFVYEDGNLSTIFSQNVLTGKMGDKMQEGDLKTPVGTYEITRRFTPPTDYYGPVAYSLSYPNLLDKVLKKTGGGIWIHGFPNGGAIREDELNTKGCVALKNDLLLDFDKLMQSNTNTAITIINEDGYKEAKKNDLALILRDIFIWKNAWRDSKLEQYLDFYDENFTRFDGMKIQTFRAMKTQIFSRKEEKSIIFWDFKISPYPNFDNEPIYRVSFRENYKTKKYKFNGIKTLYVVLKNDKMQILVEE